MTRKGGNDSRVFQRRRKMLNSCNSEDGSQWSVLPMDILMLVLFRLNLLDYFAFGGVCKSWRLLATANRQSIQNQQPPIVSIISTHANKSFRPYNLFDRSTYNKTFLRSLCGKICYGISNGYLIMANNKRRRGLWLTNPFNWSDSNFPSSQTVASSVIIASVSTSHEVIVLALSYTEYFRPRSIVRFYLSTDLGLCELKHAEFEYESFLDMAIFKGDIYALTQHGKIGILKVGPPGVFIKLEVPVIFRLSSILTLVSSSEKLLIVVSPSAADQFKIYELNFTSMEWLKVVSLGDEALFMCDMMSSTVLCNMAKWGLRSNCVYILSLWPRRCNCYSLDGVLIESFPVKDIPGVPSVWYFPNEAFSIPCLNESFDLEAVK